MWMLDLGGAEADLGEVGVDPRRCAPAEDVLGFASDEGSERQFPMWLEWGWMSVGRLRTGKEGRRRSEFGEAAGRWRCRMCGWESVEREWCW